MPEIILEYNSSNVMTNHIDSTRPDTHLGNAHTIFVGGKNGTQPMARGIIHFDLGKVPNDVTIDSATLILKGSNQYYSTVNLHNILEPLPLAPTWNTCPPYDPSIEASFRSNGTSGTTYELNVTSLVQKWISVNNYGVLLEADVDTQNNPFSIAGGSANARPQLIINYSIPTDKKNVDIIDTTYFHENVYRKSFNAPISSNRLEGDLLLLDTNSAMLGLLTPDGWTLLETVDNYRETWNHKIFYKISDGTEESVTLTFSDTGTVRASITVFRNVRSVNLISSVKNSSSDIKALLPTTTAPDSLILFHIASNNFNRPVTNVSPSLIKYMETHSGGFGYGYGIYTHNRQIPESYLTFTKYITSVITYKSLIAISLEPIQNEPPDISGESGFLGSFSSPFRKSYIVTDNENEPITIKEKLNGEVIDTKTTAGTHALELSRSQWDSLPYGKNQVSIEANDTYNNPPHKPTIRTWTFLKTLPTDAESPELIKALENTVPVLQKVKRDIASRVGVPESTKMEDIIPKIVGYGKGFSKSSATVKSFPYAISSTNNAYYMSLNTSVLGFRPKHIIVWGRDKADGNIYHWFDFEFYQTGNYKTSENSYPSYYRIPFVNGILELPVAGRELTYEWIAISE